MRYASLSLDLENQWSCMKTHGDAGWQSHPTYPDAVLPRILEFLAARRPFQWRLRSGRRFDIVCKRHVTITMGEHARRASREGEPLRTLIPAYRS